MLGLIPNLGILSDLSCFELNTQIEMFNDCEEYIGTRRKLVYLFYINSADYLQLLVRYLLRRLYSMIYFQHVDSKFYLI